ncbi:MAG: hypothetical protein VB086_04070 [Clostridiaceae bacterium]|nr:hypothetical protein [Clostridiaceae bacterium]
MKNQIKSVVLTLSIIANLVLVILLFMPADEFQEVGSYADGSVTAATTDRVYLVLDQESQYMLYKQYNVLETGTYAEEALGVYCLISDEGQMPRYVVHAAQEQIYYITYESGKANFISMGKFSDVPTYLNVKAPPLMNNR